MEGFYTILFSIIAAAVIFHLRSSMIHARQQKMAWTRLLSYLSYWHSTIWEDETISNLFVYGAKWNRELKEIYNKGGNPKDIRELEENKKEIIAEFKTKIENIDTQKFMEDINIPPAESIHLILDIVRTARKDLIEGKTFISDEEATSLGFLVASNVIELRMNIVSIIDTFSILAAYLLSHPEKLEINKYSKEISNVLWSGIIVSKCIDDLNDKAIKAVNKSIIDLTIENIL